MLVGINIFDYWLHEAALVLHCKHGRLPFLYLGILGSWFFWICWFIRL